MTDERNISLTEEEIRELIANEFPRLITQNPEIRYELIGVMSETFAKKEDITTILNELKQMREESERQRGEFRQEMQSYAKNLIGCVRSPSSGGMSSGRRCKSYARSPIGCVRSPVRYVHI